MIIEDVQTEGDPAGFIGNPLYRWDWVFTSNFDQQTQTAPIKVSRADMAKVLIAIRDVFVFRYPPREITGKIIIGGEYKGHLGIKWVSKSHESCGDRADTNQSSVKLHWAPLAMVKTYSWRDLLRQ